MDGKRKGVVLVAALTCAAAVVPTGLAEKPAMTKEQVDETFADGFLTAQCGIP